MDNFILKKRTLIFFIYIASCASKVLAAPPFITDDPSPVDFKHWEIYLFANLDKTNNAQALAIPSLELNYGIAPNLEINAILGFLSQTHSEVNQAIGSVVPPIEIIEPDVKSRIPNAYGFTDTEIGIKYAFIQDTHALPQVAFSPSYIIPTGNVNRGLGNGRPVAIFPIWIQKTWGLWVSYGGGGYTLNSAPGTRNFAFGGWVLQKDINENLMLGVEIFSEGRQADDSPAFILVKVGATYNFKPNFKLLLSMGHSIIGAEHWLGYAGLGWTV